MELRGKITQILEVQSGEGRNGTWKKQDYIIEYGDQYPKKVCFNLWGDKIDQFKLEEGEDVTVFFDIESREFNSRWYTDVKAWKVEKGAGQSAEPNADFSAPPVGDAPPPPTEEDDLPF